jgi:uncharacterized protein YecE (DUF72 family)
VRDEVWHRFAEALLPLDSAGKLGVVLFQFPPWFLPGSQSKEYILEARERLRQYRIAVEFRNSRWFGEKGEKRTLDFLRDNKLPLVCVDEPQGFPSSIPPVAEATSPEVSLVRFHGRNAEMWQKRGATVGERFDYLYSEEELAEWVDPVQQLAEGAREVHVLMNNCVRDKAVVNAAQIRLMLGA